MSCGALGAGSSPELTRGASFDEPASIGADDEGAEDEGGAGGEEAGEAADGGDAGAAAGDTDDAVDGGGSGGGGTPSIAAVTLGIANVDSSEGTSSTAAAG